MLINFIYSWRNYVNIKSGLLLDYYFKKLLHLLLFRNLFLNYNRYLGEKFLIEYLSFNFFFLIEYYFFNLIKLNNISLVFLLRLWVFTFFYLFFIFILF